MLVPTTGTSHGISSEAFIGSRLCLQFSFVIIQSLSGRSSRLRSLVDSSLDDILPPLIFYLRIRCVTIICTISRLFTHLHPLLRILDNS